LRRLSHPEHGNDAILHLWLVILVWDGNGKRRWRFGVAPLQDRLRRCVRASGSRCSSSGIIAGYQETPKRVSFYRIDGRRFTQRNNPLTIKMGVALAGYLHQQMQGTGFADAPGMESPQ